MTPTLEGDLVFMDYLGRHLGVLTVEYVPLNDGKDNGNPLVETCSGFFIILDNQWYFISAGHVFERTDNKLGLRQALDQKAIRVTKASIADFFGSNVRVSTPTSIDFHSVIARTVVVIQDDVGLDFAFVPLQDRYSVAMHLNGIVPLTEDQWQNHGDAGKYVLIGFPDEEKTPSRTDASIDASVRMCMARMDKCDIPSHLPTPTLPYFAAKLPNDGPVKPVGFSGSPIFTQDNDATGTYYSLHAIDYKWYPAERIIVGCLMTHVVAEFRKQIAKP
jgi:hypothetical protein